MQDNNLGFNPRKRSDQEEFVLSLLDNKKEGYYVELGAAHSTDGII
jgi:hypothetical protein